MTQRCYNVFPNVVTTLYKRNCVSRVTFTSSEPVIQQMWVMFQGVISKTRQYAAQVSQVFQNKGK